LGRHIGVTDDMELKTKKGVTTSGGDTHTKGLEIVQLFS
jgi:hypothetical protein